jgi:hypothetical protein
VLAQSLFGKGDCLVLPGQPIEPGIAIPMRRLIFHDVFVPDGEEGTAQV